MINEILELLQSPKKKELFTMVISISVGIFLGTLSGLSTKREKYTNLSIKQLGLRNNKKVTRKNIR
ncbi:hypothetical protein ACJROX_12900 [Pseudalkalibacillus sp. A8]|uniref:hypothetical protein n=1 Tax=Pseudalkalibacillus sp. A8 TaxID=3382641 RepID=UPI0038B47970